MTNNKNKIAILVGAGAVENAWTPLLNIFKINYGNETDSDSVNFLLAKSICALRLYSKSPKSAIQLKEEQESVRLMKEVICEELKQAQNSGILKPRKEFTTMLNKFVLCNPNNLFGFVSTNWDTVIDVEADRWVKEKYMDIESTKVFHIHGSIEAYKDIYLPSETSMENYRSDEENYEVGYDHFITAQFMSEANVIILYGISLDPLDAELNLLLSGAFTKGKTIREVIIINPDYQKIRKRVKILLLPRSDITIRCFKPQNLEIEL
ncbi:hypothetical protein E6C50_04385 [Flavobacterium supellecticarium]|uniref:SIR2-like domain-containing protein n=1 Tax=Flavobacterium supellecticarium TaxID=2565924 RepID=A0A4S4A4P8_9FLAO|nr:hypothetical protein [Flavobacterium supellecticarium]THF53447.1 hypothetical protein E6C50_04385 [Flavobacterium supellecticarium]